MSLSAKISTVLDQFNFDKVHNVMTFLNWTWAHTRAGGCTVPTIEELRWCAYECLSTAIHEFEKAGSPPNGMNIATGGFEATINVYKSGATELQLIFYVDCIGTMVDQPGG